MQAVEWSANWPAPASGHPTKIHPPARPPARIPTLPTTHPQVHLPTHPPVDDVAADVDAHGAADGAGVSGQGVGGADDLASLGHHVLALQGDGHHGAAGDVLNQACSTAEQSSGVACGDEGGWVGGRVAMGVGGVLIDMAAR